MQDETWESVTVIRDTDGVPHVLQQRVEVYTQGPNDDAAGYTKPTPNHRLVPLKNLVEL